MIGYLPWLRIFHDALCLFLLSKLLVVADHNEASPWNKKCKSENASSKNEIPTGFEQPRKNEDSNHDAFQDRSAILTHPENCSVLRSAGTVGDILGRIFKVAVDSVDATTHAEQEMCDEHPHVKSDESKPPGNRSN